MNNILITSAGRRVELVKAFSAELKAISPDSKIYTADINADLSAACSYSKNIIELPRVTDADYPHRLLEQCIQHSIKMIIPTIDTELKVFSEAREHFRESGIQIIISDKQLIKACRDKRITAKLFSDLNIDTPTIYSRDNIAFPCFAKPYDGSCSVGAQVVHRKQDITSTMHSDEKLMFMELVDPSFTEFTIDAYYDKDGTLKCLVPRERIEVRGGEVSKGVTRKTEVYNYLLEKLKHVKGARGVLTVQLFTKKGTDKYYALEINPRFGGGYPLSYHAGANYPRWLISEYFQNTSIDFNDQWKTDLLMLRYDTEVIVDGYQ